MLEYKPIKIIKGNLAPIPHYAGLDAEVSRQILIPMKPKKPEETLYALKQWHYKCIMGEFINGSLLTEWQNAHEACGDSYKLNVSLPYWLLEAMMYYTNSSISPPVTIPSSQDLRHTVSFKLPPRTIAAIKSLFTSKESLILMAHSECRSLSRFPILALMHSVPSWFNATLTPDEKSLMAIYYNRLEDSRKDAQGKPLKDSGDDSVISCYIPQWLSMRATQSQAFELKKSIKPIAGLLQAVCNNSLKMRQNNGN